MCKCIRHKWHILPRMECVESMNTEQDSQSVVYAGEKSIYSKRIKIALEAASKLIAEFVRDQEINHCLLLKSARFMHWPCIRTPVCSMKSLYFPSMESVKCCQMVQFLAIRAVSFPFRLKFTNQQSIVNLLFI